jgi:hypothetical protein
VYFDMLGEVLERLIDDGRWRQIDVSILDAKASAKPSRHDVRPGHYHGVPAPGRVTYRPFIPSGGGPFSSTQEISSMSLRFKGADLRPVLTEAIANQCRVVLVKDQGVYFLAERGERRPDGRQQAARLRRRLQPGHRPVR